ncbi:hypothetical protein [Paraburkholderia diazotrophica]|uniref:Uncharacterized protein n=1 Tax=Paraburkholderia diazotrophica TaxID=667676 RepID=A0A1H6RSC2_9BURK|nr:hypothetical protein [Paraburkholderia diazotrophica]SEI55437.1 hypothetical protein SAMN05192539_1002301 [Paraburkholderia diazotrophica]
MTITDALEQFGGFHDWYLDVIATSKEGGANTPNTLILGLCDQSRRATVTFCGVTRASIVDGGLLNIVNSIEVLTVGNAAYPAAIAMLKKSAHFGTHSANHIAYLFSTVGAEIAVEFDSLKIEPS